VFAGESVLWRRWWKVEVLFVTPLLVADYVLD
jgi:hypothetical protein